MKRTFYTAQGITQALFFVFFLAFNICLNAQATLSVQGVLTKSDGTAVDDGNDYVLTFRLWKSESGTAPSDRVHLETIDNISIVGGVYSVILGINPATPLVAPFNQTYWLGVSVGSSSVELLPRPRLTHAPYALGLVGQNNVVPSTGPIIGDAFRAKGGAATGGLGANANGFAFQSPSGDESGGMYSEGANNIELWAGASKKIKLTNGLNELFGQTNTNALNVFGALTSNDHTINGNSQVNGWQVVTGDERVEGNQFCNGKFLSKRTSEGGGYTFDYDGGYDTGMFGIQDGEVDFRSNGSSRLLIGSNGINYHSATVFNNGVAINDLGTPWNNSPLKVYGLREGPSGGKNVQYDLASGSLYWDNSSRKSKRDIQKFQEDFSRILQTEAKIYRRNGSPDSYWEIGYIAEEIDSLGLTHLVSRSLDGAVDGLEYDRLGLYAIELLKIQHAEIAGLRAELNALKAEYTAVTDQNNTLKTANQSMASQQAAFNAQLEALSKRMLLLESGNNGGSRK